jgi:acetyl/propionyl-CoA carboxylase alpha subunit
MSISVVAIYSDADAAAPHVRLADEAYNVGPALPAQSYLNQERIIEIARESGAEAIHPGYGFLSENADFARRCAEAGIVFIGPPAAAIAAMGSKIEARRAAKAAGVPIVPGTETPLADAAEIAGVAALLGYPVAIKAAAGGGGYGMRIVGSADDIQAALDGVRRDAHRAFGDTTVYVEKFFAPAPRHVEIQILGDQAGRVVHLGERECSLQRRFQKVVEETPSPAIDDTLRHHMGEAAVALAREIGYQNAGTIECLVDNDGNFYFLEMNTRLQVEHPVTEMVTGVDLVREMVRLAAGQPLTIPAAGIRPHGHAIEVRVYAEDPSKNFMPSPGEVTKIILPDLPHVRIDSAIEPGSKITVYYDPLIAKVIAWGEDRPTAIATLRAALALYDVEGPKTNLPFLRRLVASEDFFAGHFHTRYLDEHRARLAEPA